VQGRVAMTVCGGRIVHEEGIEDLHHAPRSAHRTL
jgi:hypothetical protein